MTEDPLFGPAFPERGWVPAPRYLLRRARIQALTKGLPPGRVLETGPGAGTLLIEFARCGFTCEALETSEQARALAEDLIGRSGAKVTLHEAVQPGWSEAFDYLFSFDVIEHIADDVAALRQWVSWLKPGGTILLSVPARMELWSPGDEWAGHHRRYEKAALIELLTGAGLSIDAFECYGFPLANLAERASAGNYRRMAHRGDSAEATRKANNDRSGIDRAPQLRLWPYLSAWPGRIALRSAMAVQNLFLQHELGNGYLVRASKR